MMKSNVKTEYNELARANVSDARSVIISECSKGGFTIAQQIKISESDKDTIVFLKGAIHIDNIDSLIELRNAINMAIDTFEKK